MRAGRRYGETCMKKKLTIVSRQSALALAQARLVQKSLKILYPSLEIHIIGIITEGDQKLETPLFKLGGKGLFVKALEEKLLNHQADIAVHSLKDMPMELPKGLELAAILEREDPRDVLVSQHFSNLQKLPTQSRIGTSSLRRQSQLLALRQDFRPTPLRGNLDTRLAKLNNGEFEALILASAGLKRLGLEKHIRAFLEPAMLLPAIGQGALSIECRIEDAETKRLISPLHHLSTAHCVLAERSMGSLLGSGCQSPIAGLAHINADGSLTLQGMVGSIDGLHILKASASGKPKDRIDIGKKVAAQLLAKGAQAILESYP